MKRPTGRLCVYCEVGEIVELIITTGPPLENMIFGPGSKGQFHEESQGYHCNNCGLKYEFVPDADIIKKTDKIG